MIIDRYGQKPMQLILASASPRRKQLLQQHGYAFRVVAPEAQAEDCRLPGESPSDLVRRLAEQKAANVALAHELGLFLGADTVAECHGEVLGKPVDRDHARRILQALRGQEHSVLTGFCLWRRPDDEKVVRVETTRLFMDPMSDELLESYLDSEAWRGKAGAFGYQDGLDWVRILEGTSSNVVGLPMDSLADALGKMGFSN